MNIIVTGDFCPQDRVAELFKNGDFSSVLGGVKDIVSKADYSIVNLECPVISGGESPISKVGPNLYCSEKGIESLGWAGFNCATVANNHFFDFGNEGVSKTLKACKKFHIDIVGGGGNLREASQVLYKELSGQCLAIVNCCEHEFSIATENEGGANPLNPVHLYYTIKEAKRRADFVLVIIHGGHELWQLPSPRMVDTYRFFIDSGADSVVNHHQHCYSGYEIYKGKPIFYGLGNFCFDAPNMRNSIWNEGVMVKLSFSKDIKYDIIPFRQCSDQPCIEILPQGTYSKKMNELNDIIRDERKLKHTTDSYYSDSIKQYSNIFEPIQNRFYIACKRRGWLPSLITKRRKLLAANYIGCESHRDKLLSYLFNNHL